VLMSDSKSPQNATTASVSVRRAASVETLPRYTAKDEGGRPPSGDAENDREASPPPIDAAASSSTLSKRGLLGKLKEKLVVSKADLEAERQQQETTKQEYLARIAKRREEIVTEQDKDGGPFEGEPNAIEGLLRYTRYDSKEKFWLAQAGRGGN